MKNKLPVIIDTDMGIDDALAMLVALRSDKLDIKLITTVSGNVKIEQVNKNILYMCEKYSNDIPIASGASKPLFKKPVYADDVHGKNGFGNFEYEEPKKKIDYDDAVEGIREVLENAKEKITLITLGPLTNIAKFIEKYPNLLNKIEKAYCMIGSYTGVGNITEYAEFNAFVDPDSIIPVVESGMDIIFSPMELGWETALKKEIFLDREIKTFEDNMIAKMIEGSHETYGENLFCIHDLSTILGVISPELFDFPRCDAIYSKPDEETFGKLYFPLNENGKFRVQKCKDVEVVKQSHLKNIYGG